MDRVKEQGENTGSNSECWFSAGCRPNAAMHTNTYTHTQSSNHVAAGQMHSQADTRELQ